jgi:hypothetical protein
MSTPDDARDGAEELEAIELPDIAGPDESGTFASPTVDRVEHRGGFSVELFQPGAVGGELAGQLVKLRTKSCMPIRSADSVARQLETNPVVVGLQDTDASPRPQVALYVTPTRKWLPTREALTDGEQYRSFASLEQAKFLNVVEFGCTQWAVEGRFTWRVLRDALKLFAKHAPEDHRVLTYTPASDLQRFCQRGCANGGEPVRDFWKVMSLVVESSRFESLSDLSACFGNMPAFVDQLCSCGLAEWKALREQHGDDLNAFLKALASTFALELHDAQSGQDRSMDSRFHRFHGARLADVTPDGDPDHLKALGVIYHFEYRYPKMPVRRDRYRDLRRSRRKQ